MGWFAIACICGFLGYRARPILSNWLTRSCRTTADNVNFLSVFIGFIIVFVGLILWAILSEGARTFDQFSDALSRGQVARFLFGLVLGSGAALVLAERPSGQTGTGVATAAPAEKSASSPSDLSGSATENDVPITLAGGLRPHFILSTALGITLLALAGPHVDAWLSHLTGFKSPLVELQVASTSTHKVSVVEGSETLFNIDSIEYLITYPERLEHDINYITTYGQKMSKQKDILASANRILPAFRDVLRPVASCIKSAMAEDWLSIDQARQMVRPTASLGEQIIFGEGALSDAELVDRNQKFWQSLIDLPRQIRSLVNSKDCNCTPTLARSLSFQENKNVPYLYVTAALLTSFMADDDEALRILQRAKDSSLYIKDYFFLYMIARLFYYTGKPGEIADSYFGPLNEMYSMARTRIDTLQRANQKCVKDVDLLCREQRAEVIAIDAITYYIAEDLARGSKDVTSYVARLKEFAGELKRIADEADNDTSNSNDYYSFVRGEKYRYLDTYAYAALILEAQKSNPDYDLIRRKVVGSLEEVVENVSAKDARSARIDRANLAQLRIFQAHLASAKSLVGE